MEERNQYVYGSAARQMQAAPLRKPEYEGERQRRTKTRRKPKKRVDRVSVIITVATLAAAFFVCFSYLEKQFEASYLSNEIVSLQSEIVDLEKDNSSALESVTNSIDLATIYKRATKELGMVSAKDNQVFSYASKKSNQIRQHGDIPKK